MSAALGVYGAVVRSHPKMAAPEVQARLAKLVGHIRPMMLSAFPFLQK